MTEPAYDGNGKNPNHYGPHCAGSCEGAAYTAKIRELEARLAEAENQCEAWKQEALKEEGIARDYQDKYFAAESALKSIIALTDSQKGNKQRLKIAVGLAMKGLFNESEQSQYNPQITKP